MVGGPRSYGMRWNKAAGSGGIESRRDERDGRSSETGIFSRQAMSHVASPSFILRGRMLEDFRFRSPELGPCSEWFWLPGEGKWPVRLLTNSGGYWFL